MFRKIEIVLIAAIAENGVIGRDGGLPWRLKSDLQHFRRETLGRPVVMGRKTARSLAGPLRGRTNIVVSRDPHFAAAGMLVAPNLANALTVAHGDALRRGTDRIAVIGGQELYARTLPVADRLILTRVHLAPVGDTWFPVIDPKEWCEVAHTEHAPESGDEASYAIIVYARAQNA